jgi:hypothetical protein
MIIEKQTVTRRPAARPGLYSPRPTRLELDFIHFSHGASFMNLKLKAGVR